MWEIDNYLQLISFLRSLLLGAIFCGLYDIIRASRQIKALPYAIVFWQDFLYFIFISPIIFCFLLATTNGEVRGFIIFGITAGFFITRLLFSKILLKVFTFIFKILVCVYTFLNKYFIKISLFFKKTAEIITTKAKNILKKGKKAEKSLEKS